MPAYLQAFSINGPSETPTVLLGDTVIVNKAAYNVKLPYSNVKLLRTGLPSCQPPVVSLSPSYSGWMNKTGSRLEARLPCDTFAFLPQLRIPYKQFSIFTPGSNQPFVKPGR